jgi:hypothetical protein
MGSSGPSEGKEMKNFLNRLQSAYLQFPVNTLTLFIATAYMAGNFANAKAEVCILFGIYISFQIFYAIAEVFIIDDDLLEMKVMTLNDDQRLVVNELVDKLIKEGEDEEKKKYLEFIKTHPHSIRARLFRWSHSEKANKNA